MTIDWRRSIRYLLLFLVLGAFAVPALQPAEAQLGKRIKNRIKRDAERRVEDRAVDAARRTLDLAEDAIVCAVTDEKCIEEARDKGQEPVIVDKDGKPVSGYDPAGGGDDDGGTPGQGVWANFDFVSGDSVLFVHDFEGTRTGNFPSRIDYIAGNLDVVRLGTGDKANKVLRVGEGTSESGGGGNGCFTIPLSERLPERFTLEFRVMTTDPLLRAKLHLFSDGSDDTPDTRCNYPPNPHVFVNGREQGLQLPGGYGAGKAGENVGMAQNEWMTVALGCDGPYCKMYVNGKRVANVRISVVGQDIARDEAGVFVGCERCTAVVIGSRRVVRAYGGIVDRQRVYAFGGCIQSDIAAVQQERCVGCRCRRAQRRGGNVQEKDILVVGCNPVIADRSIESVQRNEELT